MNKAPLFSIAGLTAGILAAGNAAATPASDRVARGGGHAGWSKAKADDGRMVPVWSHAGWSRADWSGVGYAQAGWDYPGWSHGGYGYGYPGTR